MTIYYLAALTAAFLWALSSVISQITTRHLGSFEFNRVRLWIATAILVAIVLLQANWQSYPHAFVSTAILSGLIGIFFGDAVLFAAFRRVGARRASILFATNAPMTVALGALILDEHQTPMQLIGIAITITGVVIAIIFGKRKSQISQWEEIVPPLWIGVMLGLGGALGQAMGSIIIRPVMEANADPFVTALLRVGIAAIGFQALRFLWPKRTAPLNAPTPRILGYVALQAFFGMTIGMTLLLFAFSGADAGIVAVLSATTPALVLPIIWFTTKECPAPLAWLGALLVVFGSALIFLG